MTSYGARATIVAALLAQFSGGIRGQHDSGRAFVRGSIVGEDEGASSNDNVVISGSHGGDGETISLERRHRHNYDGGQSEDAMDSGFDFYAYSMTYQPEFCRANNEKFAGCHTFMEDWEGQLTIHGLWPNRNDGSYPDTCSNEKLDMSRLKDLSDRLEQKWPNVKATLASKKHDDFWAHEWSKHGTCTGLSQEDYFGTALDLLLPTPSAVKENYGSKVSRKELEDGYLGSDMTAFVCVKGYLSEVRVCFEKMADGAAGERVSCPETILRQDNCGDEIMIASFDDPPKATE